MSKKFKPASQEQIAAWKEKHPEGVFLMEVGDKICYMRYPDLKTFKFALAENMRAGGPAFNKVIVENCWLDGDPEIKSNDAYYLGLCEQLDEIVRIPEPTVEKGAGECVITIEGYSCRLRNPDRADIEAASKNAKTPLDPAIRIIDKVWIEGNAELKSRSDLYASLLTCIEQLIEKKVASVKKL